MDRLGPILKKLWDIAITDGNTYIDDLEKQQALDCFKKHRPEMDECSQRIFDDEIGLLEAHLHDNTLFTIEFSFGQRTKFLWRCAKVDLLMVAPPIIRTVGELKKIAAHSRRANLIDTPEERHAALEFLKGEQAAIQDTYQRDLVEDAIGTLSSQKTKNHPVSVKEISAFWIQTKQVLHILEAGTYLSFVSDRLSEIADRGGRPTAIDTVEERADAVVALQEAGRSAMACEMSSIEAAGKEIEGNAAPLQVRDVSGLLNYFTCCSDLLIFGIACFLKIERTVPIFDELPQGAFISYQTSRRVQLSAQAQIKLLDSYGIVYDTVSLTEGEWKQLLSPLAAANTPKAEREALFDILRQTPQFPLEEDCTRQTEAAVQILRLISASGFMKYHSALPAEEGFVSHPFQTHFAAVIVSKADGEAWIIDTWARVVMPLVDWQKSDLAHATSNAMALTPPLCWSSDLSKESAPE